MAKRTGRTILIFLGMVLLAVFVRLFITEGTGLVKGDAELQTAGVQEICVGEFC